jgi:pimeloyl-ACP methyl ester carboxylesterase
MPELVRVSGCDNPRRRGDVVFVHGLNGDPGDYWGGPGSHWPTWLGEDLPDVGIWSLGYENAALKPRRLSLARLVLQRGFAMPLLDRAKNVLLRLGLEQLGERPLVFITHSMGGLLVKQMLRTANDSTDPKWKGILDQTRGICFIATPHIGSDLAKWACYFRALLGMNISVDELQPHQPTLRDLNQWYRDFVAREQVNIKTVSFYEMKPLSGVGLVVEQGDADPGVPHAGLYPLDDDHRSICKPTSKKTELHLHSLNFIHNCLSPAAGKSRSSSASRATVLANREERASDLKTGSKPRAGRQRATKTRCPYPGLRPFDKEDAELFFGRDELINSLLGKLNLGDVSTRRGELFGRFLAVTGDSGSGKSSLVRAGLIPSLTKANPKLQVIECRLDQEPHNSLAVAIVAGLLGSNKGGLDDTERLREKILSDSNALSNAVTLWATPPKRNPIVLFIDQFEEIFSGSGNDAIREAVLSNLLCAAGFMVKGQRDGDLNEGGKWRGNLIVIIAMRADFYPRCSIHKALRKAISDFQELVGPMDYEELHDVIVLPAHQVKTKIDDGLVDLLISEIKDPGNSLPLLQHTLRQIWEGNPERLTIKAHLALGGLQGAVKRYADSVFERLPTDEQEECRRVFMNLTSVQVKRDIPLTKRRLSTEELLQGPENPQLVKKVIDGLVEARLLSASEQTKEGHLGKATVEIVHEVLFAAWPRLRRTETHFRTSSISSHRQRIGFPTGVSEAI